MASKASQCVPCIRQGVNGMPSAAVYNGETHCERCLLEAVRGEKKKK